MLEFIWADIRAGKQVGAVYPSRPRDPKSEQTRDEWDAYEECQAHFERDLKKHCTRGKTIRVRDTVGGMLSTHIVTDAFARVRELHVRDVSDTGVRAVCDVLAHPRCKLDTLELDSSTDTAVVCGRMMGAIIANTSLRQIQLCRPTDLMICAVACGVSKNGKIGNLSIWFPQEPLSELAQFTLMYPLRYTLKIAGVYNSDIRASVEVVRACIAAGRPDAAYDPIIAGFEVIRKSEKKAGCCIL
jgi:hypothetical protein